MLGGKVEARTAVGNSLARLCTWTGPAYHGAGGPTAAGLDLALFRETKSVFVRVSKADGGVRVGGAGDLIFSIPRGVGRLRVWQRGYLITLHTAPGVPPRETLVSLGRAAARRL